ncbi:MAG: bifunctional 5,10-methylenetetrahydrofolate dehydrogenase/5,10-methenyltetrahydrofolate cyclohydrolase [Pyrinomonadaceae bacterium]
MQSAKDTKSETISGTRLLEGAVLAEQIKQEVAEQVKQLWTEHEVKPCLAAVRVGDEVASAVYVKNKIRACGEVGMRSEHHALPISTKAIELLDLISSLNERGDVDGILVQLPLPGEIEESKIIESIDPEKDVDGFHPVSIGRLSMGHPTFIPCTPAGIIELLDRSGIPIAGESACVVGRSQIVGRPMAQLLLQRDATVTICHSRTQDLASVTREAGLLIVAIGRPGFVGREHIKRGATVIDVGMNKITDEATARRLFGAEADSRLKIISKRGYTLVGDVNPTEADEVAGRRTPVPGGVGLLTVAMLMRNTLKAARLRRGLAA